MSQYTGPCTPQDAPSAAEPSTTDVARDEAADVGRSARDAGSQVAQTATDQARQVVAETDRQARDLLGEAQGQARDQASVQQQKAAQQLHSVADELHEMAAKGGQPGLATEVARQAADRIEGAASWLEQRKPGDVLQEVRDFARRRPGAFLIGAAVAGLAAGRLTRGLTSQGGPEQQPGTVSGVPAASTVETAYPAEPAYAAPAEPAYAEPANTADAYPAEPVYPAAPAYPVDTAYSADATLPAEPAYPTDAAYEAEPAAAPIYRPGTDPGSPSGMNGQSTIGESPENYYPDSGRESYQPGQQP